MTDEELKKLQKDAERRLLEMHKKADNAVHGNGMPPVPDFVSVNNGNAEKSEVGNKRKPQNPDGNTTVGNILNLIKLDKIKFDKDTSLIMALILLLSSEKSDELLILALLYIML